MKIFKFKHYKKNLDWGYESHNVSAKNVNEKFLDLEM